MDAERAGDDRTQEGGDEFIPLVLRPYGGVVAEESQRAVQLSGVLAVGRVRKRASSSRARSASGAALVAIVCRSDDLRRCQTPL